jgi:ABC-type Fe3+-siderophore transport system permease subunit
MEIKVVGKKTQGQTKPEWLIWGGLGLSVFCFVAQFIAKIIFPILIGVGIVIAIVGFIQLIINYFKK